MTRLVADERQQIGIIKALGYSDRYVFIRYIGYALIPTVFGSVLGVLFGEIFIPHVIMDVYYVLYTGNNLYYTPYNWYYGVIAIVVACGLNDSIKVVPTKQYEEIYGKKIDYNQVYGVYNKSSIVDVEKFNEDVQEKFRDNKSVEGVAFIKDLEEQTEEMVETLNSVVYILLISAALLTLVVIYNLNSINITKRRYELATLKVLGFYNNEVANYVYRENVILTFLGVIVGIFIGKYLHSYMINNIEMNEVMFGVIIERFSYLLSVWRRLPYL